MDVSPYLVVFIGSMSKLISRTATYYPLKKFGRKVMLCVGFFLAGITLLVVIAVPPDYRYTRITLVLAGRFFLYCASPARRLFTIELFPTEIRNIALSFGSAVSRIGITAAPFIVEILGAQNPLIPIIIFGILSFIAGILALFLPETNGKNLHETVEQVENTNTTEVQNIEL